MKIKFLLLAASMGLAANNAMAQFEGSDLNSRIEYSLKKAGVPEAELADSIMYTISYAKGFQDACAEQKYKDAYFNWKVLYRTAPFAQKNLYTGYAPYMLLMLTQQEPDVEKKAMYYNDMMDMFEQRLVRLDSINSYFTEKERSTRGDVLAERANYYGWICADPTLAGKVGYTFEKGYKYYADAIKEIKENGGRELDGTALFSFIYYSDLYFKQNPAHREQYLQDYLDAKDACEKMLQLAKEAEADGNEQKALQLVAKYDDPLSKIEATFAASGCANREQLIPLYEKNIEAKKTDLAYLRSAMTLMANADCDDSDIYFKAAEYAYNIEPTFESAIGMGQSESKKGNMNKMVEYYNKALELCNSDANKGKICLQIASGLRKSQQYTGALAYLDKAKNYNADLAGKAALQQANVYTLLGQYDQAITSAREASQADITLGGVATRLIAAINNAKANAAANARAKAEYEKYMAKKKAEADFWSGK